ncbi:hypothetical protein TRVL_01966 [Trypanosoma vivax]|nr:hypothetical protein TRVL_01966 [Trypanosoma vivax]
MVLKMTDTHALVCTLISLNDYIHPRTPQPPQSHSPLTSPPPLHTVAHVLTLTYLTLARSGWMAQFGLTSSRGSGNLIKRLRLGRFCAPCDLFPFLSPTFPFYPTTQHNGKFVTLEMACVSSVLPKS